MFLFLFVVVVAFFVSRRSRSLSLSLVLLFCGSVDLACVAHKGATVGSKVWNQRRSSGESVLIPEKKQMRESERTNGKSKTAAAAARSLRLFSLARPPPIEFRILGCLRDDNKRENRSIFKADGLGVSWICGCLHGRDQERDDRTRREGGGDARESESESVRGGVSRAQKRQNKECVWNQTRVSSQSSLFVPGCGSNRTGATIITSSLSKGFFCWVKKARKRKNTTIGDRSALPPPPPPSNAKRKPKKRTVLIARRAACVRGQVIVVCDDDRWAGAPQDVGARLREREGEEDAPKGGGGERERKGEG